MSENIERTPEGQRGFNYATYMEYQREIKEEFSEEEVKSIDKDRLAHQTITEYGELENMLGYVKASEEMAQALAKYVFAGELNQFEADMIGTVAMLGKIANDVMDNNERLRDGM